MKLTASLGLTRNLENDNRKTVSLELSDVEVEWGTIDARIDEVFDLLRENVLYQVLTEAEKTRYDERHAFASTPKEVNDV